MPVIKINLMEQLVVFTDGSCIRNGKPDARAGYAMLWPRNSHFSMGFRLEGVSQTNNRAECAAVIRALQTADLIDPSKTRPLVVYTDSLLVINTCTRWISKWKQKQWETSSKKSVANLDLIMQLDRLIQQRPVTFQHVRAHTGSDDWESRCNQEVDQMARNASFLDF